MKNNKTLLLLFVVLAGITIFYIYKTKYSTVKEELRDFAVKDTAEITKIYLADREGNAITLTRGNGGEWKVNDKYLARRSNILNLLEWKRQGRKNLLRWWTNRRYIRNFYDH